MEEKIITLFGAGKDLQLYQMCMRAVAISLIALLLIRISGRRSFGMRIPHDNIIAMLLGSMLSRAVVGASPFWPVVAACLMLVVLHRIAGWISVHSKFFSTLIGGEAIVLYEKGVFEKSKMARAQVCEEDIMQGLRRNVHTEDIAAIDKIVMERNGEISVMKKAENNGALHAPH